MAARLSAGTGLQSGSRGATETRQQVNKDQEEARQLTYKIDMWGLMHGCCSAMDRGCLLLRKANIMIQGEQC
jgi:hypothetical protein